MTDDTAKQRSLVCRDYGVGSLWWWVRAISTADFADRIAGVVVVACTKAPRFTVL